MRDRLIELIRKGIYYAENNMDDYGMDYAYSDVADYLLANGVVCPPCKVGDKIYYPSVSNDRIFEKTVDEILIHENELDKGYCIHFASTYIPFENIGKTVFLTKEEAEKHLGGVQE